MTESDLAQTHIDIHRQEVRGSLWNWFCLLSCRESTLMRFPAKQLSRDTRVFQDLSSLCFVSYRCSCCISIFLVEKIRNWSSLHVELLSLLSSSCFLRASSDATSSVWRSDSPGVLYWTVLYYISSVILIWRPPIWPGVRSNTSKKFLTMPLISASWYDF